MRKEARRKQREDRRINLFWRRNKSFPAQFGGDVETHDAQETLEFLQVTNSKGVTEGWRDDDVIQEILLET